MSFTSPATPSEFDFSGRTAFITGRSTTAFLLANLLSKCKAEVLHSNCERTDIHSQAAHDAQMRFGKIDIFANAVESKLDSKIYEVVVSIMKTQSQGVILNLLSPASSYDVLNPKGFESTTLRGSVILFSKKLAAEVGPLHIRVNTLVPGVIMNAHAKTEISGEELHRIALRRPGKSIEAAYAALFLVSDMASYITGEVLSVNGGLPSSVFCEP